MRVGACQTPEFLGDAEAALACIEDFARQAEAESVDLLLFAECFLQGYLTDLGHLSRHALNLRSAAFAAVLTRLSVIKPVLVFGLIEEDNSRYYNSAVVVSQGSLLGSYRKTHLVTGESTFDSGRSFPVFDMHGIRLGINICYDTQFASAAAAVAAQGAQVLLVAAQNMMRRDNAEHWKDLHHQIRAQRVRETGMWLISADVTGERDEHRIGYGPTSVINPEAEVVAQVPLLRTGLAIADIPVPAVTLS